MPICRLNTLHVHYILLKTSKPKRSSQIETPIETTLEEETEGEKEETPRIVLIHGLLLGNLASWYLSVAYDLAQTHDVLLYDLRGHGKSSKLLEGYDLKTLLLDLESLLSALGWSDRPISLAGHSYGGLIALHYTLSHPKLVNKLALLDVPLPPSQLSELNIMMNVDLPYVLSLLPVEVQRQLKGGGRRAQKQIERWKFLLTQSSILKDMRAESDLLDSQLKMIKCSSIALYGARSSCRSVATRLQKMLPDCEAYLIEDAGHFLLNEQPQSVSEHLSHFFNPQTKTQIDTPSVNFQKRLEVRSG